MRRAGLCIACWLLGCRFDDGGVPLGDDPSGISDAAIDASDPPVIDASIPDAAPPDASPPDATPPCAGNYMDFGVPGSRYRVVGTSASWAQAEADCEDDSPTSHLLVLDSMQEVMAIDPQVGGQAWIGHTDLAAEGTFLVVTGGRATFEPWQAGEPNNGGILGPEHCVELDGARINDEGCGERQGYVCECDRSPADPATYPPR